MKRFTSFAFNAFVIAAGVELLFTITIDWLHLFGNRPLPSRVGWIDFAFLFTGAVNLLLALARRDGWPAARTSGWVILGAATLATLIDSLTGLPFGRREYLGTLGPQLGAWPPAIALLQWNIIASGHLLGCRLFPQRPRRLLALLVAAWTACWILAAEPLAIGVRGWWQWMEGPMPWTNPAASALMAGLASLVAPWGREPISRADARPAWVAGTMALTFLAGKLALHV